MVIYEEVRYHFWQKSWKCRKIIHHHICKMLRKLFVKVFFSVDREKSFCWCSHSHAKAPSESFWLSSSRLVHAPTISSQKPKRKIWFAFFFHKLVLREEVLYCNELWIIGVHHWKQFFLLIIFWIIMINVNIS